MYGMNCRQQQYEMIHRMIDNVIVSTTVTMIAMIIIRVIFRIIVRVKQGHCSQGCKVRVMNRVIAYRKVGQAVAVTLFARAVGSSKHLEGLSDRRFFDQYKQHEHDE